MENANFSLIALKANVPPSQSHAPWRHVHTQIRWPETTLLQYIMCYSLVKKLHSTISKKYYNTRKEDQVVDVCLPFLLCLRSERERADDVSCLRRGMQNHMLTGR